MKTKSDRDGVQVTQADLARATKATTAAVSYWLDGRTKSLKPHICRTLADYLEIDSLWLETGEGEPELKPHLVDVSLPNSSEHETVIDELMVVINAFHGGDAVDRKFLLDFARSVNVRNAAKRRRGPNQGK